MIIILKNKKKYIHKQTKKKRVTNCNKMLDTHLAYSSYTSFRVPKGRCRSPSSGITSQYVSIRLRIHLSARSVLVNKRPLMANPALEGLSGQWEFLNMATQQLTTSSVTNKTSTGLTVLLVSDQQLAAVCWTPHLGSTKPSSKWAWYHDKG
jgi:hypothetical protein